MADLAQDDSVAMRIRFMGTAPAARELYFRGPVLEVFDGKTWHARATKPGQINLNEIDPVQADGTVRLYQVTMEPSRINQIPLLEGTLAAEPSPPYTEPQMHREGLSWLSSSPVMERVQIDARAWHIVQYGPERTPVAWRTWLQLPAGLNLRTISWALQLRQQASQDGQSAPDASALSQAVLRHIRQGGYSYTLTPDDEGLDDQGQADPNLIDRFWLERKRGFCEHFATAYVVIMRAMGVPSRVVTGFQGAELNPVDGLYVVRNSDAHAWAEFWQAGKGWVRVDPTAAVAPDRIERPRLANRARQPLPGPLSNIDPALLGHLRDYMEASNHRWNIWVLQYSRNRQLALLRDWGFSSPDWVDLVRLCGAVLVCISLIGLIWLWWTRPRSARTPWQKPLKRVHRALLAAGLLAPSNSPAPAPAMSWAGALESARANEQQRALIQPLITALRQLDTLRYAPVATSPRANLREGRALVEVIEQHARQWRALGRRHRAN
jgi:protein-glutamine gamma-glutamyltransferase